MIKNIQTLSHYKSYLHYNALDRELQLQSKSCVVQVYKTWKYRSAELLYSVGGYYANSLLISYQKTALKCFLVYISSFSDLKLKSNLAQKTYIPGEERKLKGIVPRVQVKRRPSATGLLLRTHSAGPVSQTCLLRLLRRELATRCNPR